MMLDGRSQRRLQEVVFQSFITEVNALKPGNVSRYAAGHDMTHNHFVKSAELVSPILCDEQLSAGERVFQSVRITMDRVGCNTNLGMVLLFAPVVFTLQKSPADGISALQRNLDKTLEEIDREDAEKFFAAIRYANPGGLGHAEKFDVNSTPDCSLQEAMAAAQNRDLIAKQYVTGFHDIFATGYHCMVDYFGRWKSVEWATVACYLTFLARFADSHIERKHGTRVALDIKSKAAAVAQQFYENNQPDGATDMLLEFDRELKGLNINPGTTADLTAASVLIYSFDKL